MPRDFFQLTSLVCLSLLSAAPCFGEEEMSEQESNRGVPAVRQKSVSIVKNLAGHIRDLMEKIDVLQEHVADLEKKNLSDQITALHTRMHSLEEGDYESQITQMGKDLQRLHEQLRVLESKNELDEIQGTFTKMLAEVSDVKQQVSKIEEKQEQSQVEQVLSNVVLHLKGAEEQITAIEAKLQESAPRSEFALLSSQVASIQSELKFVAQQVQEVPTAHSVKNLTVQVNNVQNQLADMKEETQPPTEQRVILESAAPRGRYGGFITGEWLLWQVYMGGSDYATQYLPPPCPEKPKPDPCPPKHKGLECPKCFKETCNPRFSNGKNRSASFDWKNGFRVGAGYILEHDNWDIYGSYTQLISNTHNTAKGPIFPLLLFQNLQIKCPCVDQCPIYCVDQAQTSWEVEFRTADLDLGREYFVGKWLSVHPAFGLKGAWIDQNLKVKYIWFCNDCLIEKFTVSAKNDFSGVGPKIGASSNWFLGKGFSLYAGLFGALLWGDFDLKQVQKHRECPAVKLKSSFNRLVPTAQGRVGFLWDGFFNKNRNHLGISVGWEMQYWWRQNQIERFTDGFLPIYVRSSDDLSMQGLTVGLRFDF